MRQTLLILPAYDLSVLYNTHKLFSPLDKYVDFDTLLQVSFDPYVLESQNRTRIWELIEQERMGWISDMAKSHDLSYDAEALEDELIDIMLDMFFEITFNFLTSHRDFGAMLDDVANAVVRNSCLYLTINDKTTGLNYTGSPGNYPRL